VVTGRAAASTPASLSSRAACRCAQKAQMLRTALRRVATAMIMPRAAKSGVASLRPAITMKARPETVRIMNDE